ncbi:hypothetical protein ACYULU_05585 [Breznakiellaceae bacterium SP9]
MAEMTDEEAEYWDEYFTQNPPRLGANGSGWLSLREARLVGMDDLSTAWLRGKAEPQRFINEQ